MAWNIRFSPSITAGEAPATFDFYISTTGTGTAAGGGTLGDPWAITMLNDATARARYGGFSVGLLDGTYDVYDLLTPLAYDAYAFTVKGSTNPATPTRIAAVNARQAILQCDNGAGSYGGGNTAGPSVIGLLEENIVIDGLKFTGHTRRGICIGGASVILDPSREGIVVKNCEFTNFHGDGGALVADLNISQIEVNDSLGTLFQNNWFHDNVGYGTGDADHFSAIEVWSAGLCIFEYNTLENQAGGLQGKAQNNDTYSNIFRYNYIDLSSWTTGQTGAGIFGFNEGNDFQSNTGRAATEIYGNVIIAPYPLLLRNVYLDSRTTRFFHPVEVHDNTLVVTSGGSIGCVMIVDAAVLSSFYNNIITRVSGSGDLEGMYHMSALMATLVDYNHHYQVSGTRNYVTSPGYDGSVRDNHSGLAAFATAMGNNSNGTTVDEHGDGAGGDPVFVGTGSGALFYQLDTGSPCIDAGTSDGTTGGSVCDQGGWGGPSPPSRIGCDF